MEKEQLIALVKKSQSGDTQAMEQLLQYAHTSVSYQCRKMLRSAQDAEDMTQEVLVTIYTKLDTLQDPGAFRKWVNQITVCRCINALERTHVEYQFAQDEEGHSILDTLEDLDEQVIPDKAIDNAETARMIAQIVDELPIAQRAATLMFYYDEMSVEEIANVMNVSENTVKSRLNYARKAIKEKVLDYEKQGIKLYGLSPLPFLLHFLQLAARNSADKDAAAVAVAQVMAVEGSAAGITAGTSAAIAGGSAASAGAAAAAGGAAATGVFASVSAKVAVGILAAVITLGGVSVAVATDFRAHSTAPSALPPETTATAAGPATEADDTSENAEANACTVCGVGQIIPVTLTQDPCADRLEVAFQCNHCEAIAGYSYPAGNGHTYGISADGQYEICTVCGMILGPTNIGHGGVTEEAAHDHCYDSVVTEPTCTSGGYTTYTCACGHSYVGDQTDVLEHDWILAVPNEPSCGIDGSNYYHCARAGCVADYSEFLPKTGHDMTDWYVLHEATTEQSGVEMRRCQNKGCDNIQTRTIPKLSSEEN